MNKAIFTALGFIIFILGMLAMILGLIGTKLVFLTFIDEGGRLMGFLIRLMMVFGGVIIIALAQTNWSQENEPEIVE